MAVKTIRDAWLMPLIENEAIYPKHETVLKIEGELRDFFAHEIMKQSKSKGKEYEQALIDLFERVFKKEE